jgi:hypothetical protein
MSADPVPTVEQDIAFLRDLARRRGSSNAVNAADRIAQRLTEGARDSAALSSVRAEMVELRKLAYVAGSWECRVCGYGEVKSILYVMTGEVGVNPEPALPCPNDGATMHPVTWQAYAKSMDKWSAEKEAEVSTLSGKLREAQEWINANVGHRDRCAKWIRYPKSSGMFKDNSKPCTCGLDAVSSHTPQEGAPR